MYKAMGKRGDVQPTITPRRQDGRCGKCNGHVEDGGDGMGEKCLNCGRLAGKIPGEVRAAILKDLAALFEDADPAIFWSKYVSFGDLAQILLTERKTLLGWCARNGLKPKPRRHPDTGKRSLFFTIGEAQALIAARR